MELTRKRAALAAVFLFFLAALAAAYFFASRDRASRQDDFAVLGEVFRDGKKYGEDAFSASFGFAHLKDGVVSITLHSGMEQQDTIDGIRKLVRSRFSERDMNEIMSALLENLEAAKEGNVFNGRVAYRLDRGGWSVLIVNWKNMSGTDVNLRLGPTEKVAAMTFYYDALAKGQSPAQR